MFYFSLPPITTVITFCSTFQQTSIFAHYLSMIHSRQSIWLLKCRAKSNYRRNQAQRKVEPRTRYKKWLKLQDSCRPNWGKKLAESQNCGQFFFTTLRYLHFEHRISIKEDTVVLNLWIMTELDSLYKNVSDILPLPPSKNIKKHFFP